MLQDAACINVNSQEGSYNEKSADCRRASERARACMFTCRTVYRSTANIPATTFDLRFEPRAAAPLSTFQRWQAGRVGQASQEQWTDELTRRPTVDELSPASTQCVVANQRSSFVQLHPGGSTSTLLRDVQDVHTKRNDSMHHGVLSLNFSKQNAIYLWLCFVDCRELKFQNYGFVLICSSSMKTIYKQDLILRHFWSGWRRICLNHVTNKIFIYDLNLRINLN